MNVYETIKILFEASFVLWSFLLLIVLAIYAVASLFKKNPDEDDCSEETDEQYCKRLESKIDLILRLHGCDIHEDSIIRPNGDLNDKLRDMNDKLDVLLCGPMDKATLEELKFMRESGKNE